MKKLALILTAAVVALIAMIILNRTDSSEVLTATPASLSEKDFSDRVYQDKSKETKIPTHHSDKSSLDR